MLFFSLNQRSLLARCFMIRLFQCNSMQGHHCEQHTLEAEMALHKQSIESFVQLHSCIIDTSNRKIKLELLSKRNVLLLLYYIYLLWGLGTPLSHKLHAESLWRKAKAKHTVLDLVFTVEIFLNLKSGGSHEFKDQLMHSSKT